MWVILLLIVSCRVCRATRMTYTPHIYDTYDIEKFNNNPYFNRTYVNESSILYRAVTDTPIDVYNLDLIRIDRIHEIDIECYDHISCEKTLTSNEIKYMSLYVSMLEACGITTIPESYSLGVLRDKTKENVVGQFTKSWYSDGSLAHMAFWIRLERNNEMIYDSYDNTQLTVAMLELAVHERAHYDVTKSNIHAGHCDMYQSQYNTLIRHSINDLHQHIRLTNHIMGNADTALPIILSVIGVIVVLVGAILIAIYCKDTKKSDSEYKLMI